MLIQHGHVNPKDRTILFFSCGDIGNAVVVTMEYHLRKLDCIIVFLEYFMMFDSLDFPNLYLIADIGKSGQALMYGVLKGKKAFRYSCYLQNMLREYECFLYQPILQSVF